MNLGRLLPTGLASALRPAVIAGRRLAGHRRRINLAEGVSCRLLGGHRYHTFFGYYDLSPFETGGSRLLSCRVARAAGHGPMEIGVYDRNDDCADFTPLALTQAWCWQQGCRLAWVDQLARGYVIFNTLGKERFEAVLFDVDERREVGRFPRALYDVAGGGRFALSLNFARLQRLRPGYGYAQFADLSAGSAVPDDDGIWLVDLQTSESCLLHSLAEAAAIEPQPSMSGAIHYFNHLSWNPSGTRFLLFHIWEPPGERRYIRLLTSDAQGHLRLVTNGRLVSHYSWIDDHRMLLFAEFDGVRGFFEVRDCPVGEVTPIRYAAMPGRDGHPTWNPATGRFLFDSLPDGLSERSIMTFRPDEDRPRCLASFYSPPALAGEHRCDLHPRWSADGSRIAVDTAHAGYRQMAVLTAPSI